jgi:hypothetical protein
MHSAADDRPLLKEADVTRLILAVVLCLAAVLAGCSTGTVKETYQITPSESRAVGQGSQYRYQRQTVPLPFQQTETVRVEGKLYSFRQAPDGTITLTPLEANP